LLSRIGGIMLNETCGGEENYFGLGKVIGVFG
jgi:hypothetical protein